MSWLEALILGIVQGLTEFLPVSSSGHLEIGQALLGTSGEDNLHGWVLLPQNFDTKKKYPITIVDDERTINRIFPKHV